MSYMTMATRTQPLSNAQLKDEVPSIFTDHKHHSRSERYGHQPTIEVLNALRRAGFAPVQAFSSRIHKRAKDRLPYAKHLIRLRERKYVDKDLRPDDIIPDIILTNAHDGTSSFKLEAGLFRVVCSNGLVVASERFATIRIPHTRHIFERVKEGVLHMSSQVPKLMTATREWDRIKLDPRARNRFAKAALELRFHNRTAPITVEQALENRRNEDEAPTLWRTFNTLQENLLMGGQQGRTASGRNTTTRLVTSVNNSLHYNRGLWELAEAFAEKAR